MSAVDLDKLKRFQPGCVTLLKVPTRRLCDWARGAGPHSQEEHAVLATKVSAVPSDVLMRRAIITGDGLISESTLTSKHLLAGKEDDCTSKEKVHDGDGGTTQAGDALPRNTGAPTAPALAAAPPLRTDAAAQRPIAAAAQRRSTECDSA